MNHELKIERAFYDAIVSGDKTFEIRYNDRGFNKGDTLTLRAVHDGLMDYSAREITVEVVYVLSGWGLQQNWVALGIRPVDQEGQDGSLHP